MKFGVTVVPSVSDWKLFVDLETMGYDCAWAADSQMLYSDAYAVLALAAAEHLAHPARHRRRRGADAARAGRPPIRSPRSTSSRPAACSSASAPATPRCA